VGFRWSNRGLEMPYLVRKQKCEQADGDSGTHVIYKKKRDGSQGEKVGCTTDPEQYKKALYASEKGMIKKESKLMEAIKMMVREELDALEEKKRKRKRKKKKKKKAAKKDACYYKVKARYSVWPSAYASGALVKCRKVGAKNWGKSKK